MGFVNLMTSVWREFSVVGRIGLVAAIAFLTLGILHVNLLNYHHWVEGGTVERIFVVVTTAFQLAVLYQFIAMIVEMERD
jgi:hypothetical protein